jgi:hypothetical protein
MELKIFFLSSSFPHSNPGLLGFLMRKAGMQEGIGGVENLFPFFLLSSFRF